MDWNEVKAALERHIRPASFPLALRMLPAGEEPPPKARRPWWDLGIRTATCQVWNIACCCDWTLAGGLEDPACPPCAIPGGIRPPVNTRKTG